MVVEIKKNKQQNKQKISIGIVLLRPRNFFGFSSFDCLLIQRRYTYAFSDFVNGNFSTDQKKLRSQLDKMTMSELLDIWSLDFDKMWFRIWISETGKKRSTRYWKKEAKFKKYFLERDNGKKIKKNCGISNSF